MHLTGSDSLCQGVVQCEIPDEAAVSLDNPLRCLRRKIAFGSCTEPTPDYTTNACDSWACRKTHFPTSLTINLGSDASVLSENVGTHAMGHFQATKPPA